jgi:hypothetical protein
VDGNDLSLSFPDGADRADISLDNGALVSVDGEGGGDIQVEGRRITLSGGSQMRATTLGAETGGTLAVTASESVEVIGESADGQVPSGLFTASYGSGDAGDLLISTRRLLVRDGAVISSFSTREGTAGNIDIGVRDTLQADNGMITISSEQSSGGTISIASSNIRLFGDSDITTKFNSGAGGDGSIDIQADSILAFDDSDILTYTREGKSGDINVRSLVLFARVSNQNYRSLIELPLPENQIDTDSLLANSCIVRRHQPTMGSFTITGTGGLPQRPGDAQMSTFPTVDIETLPSDSTPTNINPNRPWQKGDPIVEPQGVYRLPNGNLALSRECP